MGRPKRTTLKDSPRSSRSVSGWDGNLFGQNGSARLQGFEARVSGFTPRSDGAKRVRVSGFEEPRLVSGTWIGETDCSTEPSTEPQIVVRLRG